jgi:FAD/FMN-containing dehydrogenase
MATTTSPELTTIPDVADALREAHVAAKRRRARPLPLDLGALSAILAIDEISGIAHVEVGVTIGKLEGALARAGMTLRHEPPLPAEARIGDQLQALSGSICGLEACLPDGRMLRLRPGPRRAVGPDLVALATLGAPRLLVPCAVYLRTSRRGDEPWIGWFGAPSVEPVLAAARQALRRGVRPVAMELRVQRGGAAILRVEVNQPAPVRVASATILEDELARAGAAAVEAPDWGDFAETESRWLPFADLGRALKKAPARALAFTPWGAEVHWAKAAPASPRVRPASPAFEALLERLKAEIDPKGLL